MLRELIEVGRADYEKPFFAAPAELVPRAGDGPAWLFYTRGTTGRPNKGAMLPHRNLMAMSLSYFEAPGTSM